MTGTGSEPSHQDITGRQPAQIDRAWSWFEHPEISCAGRAFIGDQLLSGPELAHYLLEGHCTNKLSSALVDLNGSFAFVIGTPDRPEVAGVDRLRSIPLFYGPGGEGMRVGRTIDQLRTGPCTPAMADTATFLRCGYLLGPHTLDPGIMQVIAGSIVTFGPGKTPVVERYHRHQRCLPATAGYDRSYASLDHLSTGVGQRLVRVLDGRQALIPLSGGYDSRYVVSMLAEHGYDNVQLFTYGTPNGFEARIASQVAAKFGYPWEFIDYTTGGLVDFLRTDGWARYWRSAGNMNVLPHVQEPFALAELGRRGLIRDGAVAVPGFCGDFLGGSYLPSEVTTGEVDRLLACGLDEHLIKRVLYLNNQLDPQQWHGLLQRLSASIGELANPDSLDQFVSSANAWVAEHRVARYVINALRAYEAVDLDWYMPLWDSALVDYWYSVPVHELVAKRLYNGYLLDHRFKRAGVSIQQYPSYWSTAWFRRVRRLVPRGVVNPLWRLRDRVTGTRRFDVNAFGPIASWAIAPLGESTPVYTGNISAVLVHRYLHDVATGFESLGSPGSGPA